MKSVVIVDERDVVVGAKDFSSLKSDDIYRVSAVWITNSKNEVLLAQRSFNKTKDPGAWGPAAAGTLEEGEEYDTNIVKEIQEELGFNVSLSALMRGPKLRISTPKSNYFVQWYSYVLNSSVENLVLQKDEVEKVQWFTKADVRRDIIENPKKFTPSASRWLELFL